VHVNSEGKVEREMSATTARDLGDKITPFCHSEFLPGRSASSRFAACSQSPTQAPINHIYHKAWSKQSQPFFCGLLSLSCQTSSPPRPMRAQLQPSAPSQRMLSERQTQVIQVSFCDILNRCRGVYYTPGLFRCSDGHGPCHPCSLHPVGLLLSHSGSSLHRTVWTDFSMLTQRVQSGSTAIVLCFLMGAFSLRFRRSE
jgi:hypothetical protein